VAGEACGTDIHGHAIARGTHRRTKL
jgi:hypothetical protein